MLYKLFTSMPPDYVWAILLLLGALVAHHAVRGRKWWSVLTGMVLSVLLGWLAETLGLGWYATEVFGSKWIALGVYVAAGFIWLAVESFGDLRQMIPRFEEYAENYCKKECGVEWSSMPLPKREALLRTELLAALENRNRNNPRDPILFPHFYYRSRERRWWFVSWFLFWPAYLLNAILSVAIVDPWKLLSQLLPTYVRMIQKLIIPVTIPLPKDEPSLRPDDDHLESTS